MKQHLLYILWDESHIWGLIAWRAAAAMGLPYQLVKGKDIAQGVLSGKSSSIPPGLLLVPGGTARLKALSLGKKGCEAIRQYVAKGGQYLGICGGAGLGLSDPDGLGLCPWTRAAYTDRLQHLVSGHVLARCTGERLTPLPVWWPGRFDPQPGSAVTVLATYDSPADDLWMADLPLHSLPNSIFGEWQALYGINMRPDFMRGQPCVIHGAYGLGNYTLSYSHLETPHSPDANTWLAQLLHNFGGFDPITTRIPPWDVEAQDAVWPLNADTSPLWEAREGVRRIMELGLTHNLLFRRTEWLWGWRAGIPGAALNNIYASLCTALALPPTAEAMAWWYKKREAFCRTMPLFCQGVEGYLLAERLATTLNSSLPDAVDRQGLKVQRTALFGPPMSGGGMYKELLDVVDELVFLLA